MARTRHARVVRWDQPTYATPNRARGVTLARALVDWRHRLVADQRRENLARIAQVHAASARLQPSPVDQRHLGPDKQETPSLPGDEASTDLEPVRKVPGGCSAECA